MGSPLVNAVSSLLYYRRYYNDLLSLMMIMIRRKRGRARLKGERGKGHARKNKPGQSTVIKFSRRALCGQIKRGSSLFLSTRL